jgi:hypothetical protein
VSSGESCKKMLQGAIWSWLVEIFDPPA